VSQQQVVTWQLTYLPWIDLTWLQVSCTDLLLLVYEKQVPVAGAINNKSPAFWDAFW
jgi:hypothetical protein